MSKRVFRKVQIWGFSAISLFLVGLVSHNVLALTQGVAQGYFTDDSSLRPGMVVRLSDAGTPAQPKVERADDTNYEKIIGLATNPTDSFAVIANGQQQVYVQTSGDALAYVSDLGGQVKRGDLLTISPLKGILMRAASNQNVIFGTALEDFPASGGEKFQINPGSGNIRESLVARLTVNLDSRSFAHGQASNDSVLARIGRSVVGKEVGEIRVLIALIIFFIVLVAEGGIIYGAVSSAITAMGRNPLAGKLIKRELIRVLFVAFGVLSLGLGAIYGILWI